MTSETIRREAAANDAARALNAAYFLNRTARTTGDPTSRWQADTALVCARRDVEKFARVACLTYDVAMKEAEVLRPTVGVLTLPVW